MSAGNERCSASRQSKLGASIEMLPAQIMSNQALQMHVPAGTRVYIADVGTESSAGMVAAAARLSSLSFIPVPHIAARRFATRAALEAHVGALAETAGVTDVLLIAGSPRMAAGVFSSTIEVLDTGVLDRFGISDIAVAGHPEASPDFSAAVAQDALRLKAAFAQRTGASMRIVTQFGFDPQGMIAWARSVRRDGIGLPIHLGVAGPARLTTLMKYAALCGVGNSAAFLRNNGGSLASLVAGHSPEQVAGPIEAHLAAADDTAIVQLHVFPFGGFEKASEWLRERGSWSL